MPNKLVASQYQKAIFCVILAYLSISLMSVFAKQASDTLHASEILFARFFIGLLFLLPFMIRDGDFHVERKQWGFLVLRNVAGIAAMLINFYVIKYLPVSLAVLLMNTAALFIPVLLLFFRIKTSLKVIACCLLGFVGVAVILLADQGQSAVDLTYVLIGLGGAIFSAMAFLSLQELNKHNSPKNIVFYFHLIGSLSLPLFFFNQWIMPDLQGFLLLLMVGVFGLGFQLMITRAFKYAPANIVTPFSFTGVIFSGIFDWLFWAHAPSFNFWFGSLIIIIAVSTLAAMKKRA